MEKAVNHVRLSGAIVGAVLLSIGAANTQSLPTSGVFSCVKGSNGSACPLATPNTSLESNTTQFAIGAIVSVSGYHSVGDGGAGQFVMLGAQPNVCNTYGETAQGSLGSTTLNNFGTPSPTLQVQPGSEIASITTDHDTIVAITLTLPLALTLMGGGVEQSQGAGLGTISSV